MRNYGIHAGEEGMLGWEWATERLGRSRNYWISSTRPDGRPHAAPVWGVWLDGALFFGTGPGSRKGRNLTANPEVVAHLESGDEVVILEGAAERVEDAALLRRVGEVYAAKYDFDPTGGGEEPAPMYAVRPRVAYGWLERDFPATATRWRFDRDA